VPINSARGSYRQIIGWREIRGAASGAREGPGLFRARTNWVIPAALPRTLLGRAANAHELQWRKPLARIRAIKAYAHHIQRLMVTGNFPRAD